MGVRKKLVELLKTNACQAPFMCDPACRYYGFGDCFPDRFADHLISNGVTVHEWVSANDRLPNEPMRCLVYTKRGKYWGYEITYYNQGFYTQYAEAIYWMPLPQPPKGE